MPECAEPVAKETLQLSRVEGTGRDLAPGEGSQRDGVTNLAGCSQSGYQIFQVLRGAEVVRFDPDGIDWVRSRQVDSAPTLRPHADHQGPRSGWRVEPNRI